MNATTPQTSLRGILRPGAVGDHFTLERHPPRPELAPYVELYWVVRWDCVGASPYLSETLPFPNVNLAFERGRSALHGIPTRRFSRQLEGRGWVLGVKWHPGGLRGFVDRPMHAFTDRVVPIREVFGAAGEELDADVLADDDDLGRIARVESFLLARAPTPDPRLGLVRELMRVARESPAMTRVEALAADVDLPVRTLQRMFREHVGVSPKWILQRFRIQEASERLANGEPVDLARLAFELGYADQAHLAKDFKAQIGRTPTEYAAACRSRV